MTTWSWILAAASPRVSLHCAPPPTGSLESVGQAAVKQVLAMSTVRAFVSFCWVLLAGLAAQGKTVPLTVKGMPDDAPLVVVATHDGATLRVVADLADGWHLYGRDVGGGQPVVVRIGGGAFAANGALRTPMDEKGLITGKATLELPLQRVGEGDELTATMAFMVCDALRCLPPIELELQGPAPAAAAAAAPLRVLLVAIDDGERTQRIAGHLRGQGLLPTVTTHALVTTELCDANDVVIADSPTFTFARKTKVHAEVFAKSKSPVVAVGYLGTHLLEANKVAMACGYI